MITALIAPQIKSVKYEGKWIKVRSFRIGSNNVWFNISSGPNAHWIGKGRVQDYRMY